MTSQLRGTIDAFVAELRFIGIPIALSDGMDALRALAVVPLGDREHVRAALLATLVKRQEHVASFNVVFDVFFGGRAGEETVTGSPLAALTDDELAPLLVRTLASGDETLIRILAKEAVARFGGFQPGRPVAGTYYVLRTLRSLDLGAMESELRAVSARELDAGRLDPLGKRLADDKTARLIDFTRKEVEAEVRALVARDRGAAVLARTLRKPLPENLDFLNASAEDIAAMRRTMAPLARRLASRLKRRRRGRGGALDFRATIRRSMGHGGVPAELKFRAAKPAKPELVVVADISGSVASFAGFTLQLLYALHGQFSRVRSFVFVDGITEVTELLAGARDLTDFAAAVNERTGMLWIDGHSDYGHALRVLADRWGSELRRRTSVIILGDARNNYHAAQASALSELRARVRGVYWLNPEPVSGWDTGDSIISEYAPHCDQVRECRTLAQLERFIEELV
jgi:uncharacterized protein with von Willebrand factor type A (vWA) domain